jgi:cell division septation protein DedD
MATNRRDKDRRWYFTRGQMVLLGFAFTLASIVIFGAGMFVGKEIEARKMPRVEEPLVNVPVAPGSRGTTEAEGAKTKDDLTFYNTLTKAPAAKPAVDAQTEEKSSEKTRATPEPEPKAEPAVSAETTTGETTWSVQANSYPDLRSANDLVDRLKNKGYNAFVTEANIKGKVWYRVRVGRFRSREEAEKTEAALKTKENLGKAFATRK